ncbi:DUF2591 family protein [Escherichia coli]|nr:DUF2591 family protein [Escherichia coli]
MKVKTAELSGVQLDYAVAMAVDHPVEVIHGEVCSMNEDGNEWVPYAYFKPSTDWGQCGVLIEQHDMNVSAPFFGCEAWANIQTGSFAGARSWKGATCQEAICRAVVASKLGDEVDIPDELMESQQ